MLQGLVKLLFQTKHLRHRSRHVIIIIIIIIIIAEMVVFNMAGYLVEERRRWPVITASPRRQLIFQMHSELWWKKGAFGWENRTSCLVGPKTHPTIVPRLGFELTTSRLHSFIMAQVSHALNHSATEAELTTSCLRSFIMAEVSHALKDLLMWNWCLEA